jgi:hypothetical protein
MLSELHNFNLKLCSKKYNKIVCFAPDCGTTVNGVWQHNYSTKIWQTGHANDQSMYSLMSVDGCKIQFLRALLSSEICSSLSL